METSFIQTFEQKEYEMVMLLLPLSDMKHLFDFKRLLGHLVQGCVIVLTRHLLHIDTIITLL